MENKLGTMGQDIVIRILLDLGGKGKLAEITKWGLEHYPDSVRDKCQITCLLYRMRRKYEVERTGKHKDIFILKDKEKYIAATLLFISALLTISLGSSG